MAFFRHLLGFTLSTIGTLAATLSIASAETKALNLLLNSDGIQTFETLLQQAQYVAKTSIEQEFTNPGVTEVSVLISGEHNGQIVPILQSNVSRSQWQNDSRIHRWTRYYFGSSGVLLGYYNPAASPAIASPARPSPTPPSPGASTPVPYNIEDDPAYRDD